MGVNISLIFYRPQLPQLVYSKRYLHEDEVPFFMPGNKEVYFDLSGHKIAPAICYESLLPEHAEQAVAAGSDIYLASVAKPAGGVEKAQRYFPELARKHNLLVLMANCVGPADNFESVGQSAVWNRPGDCLGSLNASEEGLLIFDTETEQVTQETFQSIELA